MWRRLLLFLCLVLPGLAAVLVSGYYLFQDWSALISVFGRFEKAAASGADLRSLYIAGTLDHVYRLNAFADGVGVMLGAILFGIGLHGLSTLPADLAAKRSSGLAPAIGALLACAVAGAVLISLMRSLNLQYTAVRASKQELVQQIKVALREGDAIADFLKTGARAHYGSDSEKLVEFGVQPFRGRRSKKSPEPPPAPEKTAPSDSSSDTTK